MTSQPGSQTIKIPILSNISGSKNNQTMKFGQLIEFNKINIFPQKSCRKGGRQTSSRSLFFFKKKKALYEVKVSGLRLSFNIFR